MKLRKKISSGKVGKHGSYKEWRENIYQNIQMKNVGVNGWKKVKLDVK